MAKIIFFTFCLFKLNSQSIDSLYKIHAESGLDYLLQQNWSPCLEGYLKAIEISGHSVLAHLRAASCAHMMGHKDMRNRLLRTAAEIDWEVCMQITQYRNKFPEFDSLLKSGYLDTVTIYYTHSATQAGINVPLMKELEKIYYDDQLFRIKSDSFGYRNTSPEYQKFIHNGEAMDSINLMKIERIIREVGYPGKSMVGRAMAGTTWLIIQHSALEIQEKYLPVIEAAAHKNEIDKGDWAYLVDRINMRKNLPQVYGSQLIRDRQSGKWIFYQIMDEKNVDKRRREVGLPSLEDYARIMGVERKISLID